MFEASRYHAVLSCATFDLYRNPIAERISNLDAPGTGTGLSFGFTVWVAGFTGLDQRLFPAPAELSRKHRKYPQPQKPCPECRIQSRNFM